MKYPFLLKSLFFIALLAVGFSPSAAFAQVKGKVLDKEGKTMPYATVMLMKASDKTFVKGALTDTEGVYEIPKVKEGTYYVAASFVGFQTANSKPFTLKNEETIAVEDLTLLANETTTQVTVTAQRPVIQVEADRISMNVEGTVNASGANGLETLQKAPGVTLDPDDNISLKGRNGVKIYIDGRPSPLSGKDLASVLRSMQSSDIDRIDLITNPSAKYDASGNAGIIDIRLKKNKAWGTNGSFTTGGSQGLNTRYNGSLTLNNRAEKTNVFGTISNNGGQNENNQLLYRQQAGLLFDQNSQVLNNLNNSNLKFGIDYSLNNKQTLGVLLNGSYMDGDFSTSGRTPISPIGGAVSEVLVANNKTPMTRMNLNGNLNYRFSDLKAKKEFNIDVDFGQINNRSNSFQQNFYKNASETTTMSERIYRNITPTDIQIYTLKADYSQPFSKKGKLEFGFKAGYVNTDNTFDAYNVLNGQDVKDLTRSNRFDYTENVNAAYVNLNQPINAKLKLQGGLRLEQTNSKGILETANGTQEPNERSYLDLFPSASASYQVNMKNALNLTFSRRIDRPSYQNLNPFEFKLDELTYQKGNPFLKPQYTNSVELGYTYNWKITTTLAYGRTRDVMTQFIDTTQTNRSFITQINLAQQDVASINVSAPIQIKKGWSAFLNVNVNQSHYQANLGTGRNLDVKALNYSAYIQQTFTVGKNSSIEVSGLYNGPFIWGGTFKGEPLGFLDLGFSHKVLQDRGSLKLTVSDILGTMKFRGRSTFGGSDITVTSKWEAQQVRLNFTYRFGAKEVKAARNRKTGLEEESRRAAGGAQGGGIGQSGGNK